MSDNPVFNSIQAELDANDVVLFMKGTPVFPQCGFSSMVVQVLSHVGVKFKGIDVLADDGIRNGIKEFSNWPTIPQLYVKVNSSAAATSSARCSKRASCRKPSRPRASKPKRPKESIGHG